jgi:hypothetical protein
MNRILVNIASAVAVAVLILGAAPTVSAQVDTKAGFHSGVVIARHDDSISLWTEGGRLVFALNPTTTMPERKVGEGNLVVVRETTVGSGIADNIILVDQEVWVEASGTNELAIIGRVDPSVNGPSQLIIHTADRQEVFVIDPKTFRQPFPEPGQRVALTYRVENVKPPRYKATGLILLPDSFDDSPVTVTYSDIVVPAKKPAPVAVVAVKAAPAPVVAPAPAPRPAPAPQPMATLPMTAGRTPAVALLGLLLVGVGLAAKFSA